MTNKLEELRKKLEEAENNCNSMLKVCKSLNVIRDATHKAADEADATFKEMCEAANTAHNDYETELTEIKKDALRAANRLPGRV